jgi:tryptophan halogenase
MNGAIRVAVVGSGTAGLISAIQLKALIPSLDVTVVSSKAIGIIGVGEGSTEHWTEFCDRVGINRREMVVQSKATYKFGIRFTNWRHLPFDDYFHSIGHGGLLKGTFNGFYALAAANNRQLTATSNHHLFPAGFVEAGDTDHRQVNQFHFDTYALNDYLTNFAKARGVMFVEGEIAGVSRSDNGDIVSLLMENGSIATDFVIDASGMKRVIHSLLGGSRWVSYSDYLPCNAAIAFPTEEREDGVILPYTIADALSSGWRWEIPTQTRRGNGYVFNSEFLSTDEAVEEMRKATGFFAPKPREFKFDPGYIDKPWINNCCAVGLSSSFVEPLEATSIAASIQQSLAISSFIPGYFMADESQKRSSRKIYNAAMESMMDNILYMIKMHYISDRRDTPMWEDTSNRPMPNGFKEFLDVIAIRGPENSDLSIRGYELFKAPHFWHVAQGQGLLSTRMLTKNLAMREDTSSISKEMLRVRKSRYAKKMIPHRQALGLPT